MRGLLLGLSAFAALAAVGIACGGSSTPPPATATNAPGGTKDQAKWPDDDRSLCNWRNHPELEVSETAGPGAIRPNIRRVYKALGQGDERRQILVCREVDTNLDGIKDVMRTFNAKGEPVKEEADTNYDGKIDVWTSFSAGRVVEEDIDTNGDGRPDVWKVYADGKLSRVKRDRNFDGKPDVWEIYTKGRLERMGVDESGDGHVDRWDRDDILLKQEEADEAKQEAGDAGTEDAGAAADAGDAGGRTGKRRESR